MSITSDYTAMHRAFREVGSAHGLRTESVRVVSALDEHGLHPTVMDLGRRLALHDTAVHRALRELRAGGFSHPPLCVWLEAPTGRFLKPTLLHMVGVTMEAVYSALESLYPFPVSLFDVGVTQWKLASVGKGTADKDEIMAWAKTVGSPANQDEADALGIAYGGLALMGPQRGAAAA